MCNCRSPPKQSPAKQTTIMYRQTNQLLTHIKCLLMQPCKRREHHNPCRWVSAAGLAAAPTTGVYLGPKDGSCPQIKVILGDGGCGTALWWLHKQERKQNMFRMNTTQAHAGERCQQRSVLNVKTFHTSDLMAFRSDRSLSCAACCIG